MAGPIFFPGDPELNDTYTNGSKTWTWDGERWRLSAGFNDSAPSAGGDDLVTQEELEDAVASGGGGASGLVSPWVGKKWTASGTSTIASSIVTGRPGRNFQRSRLTVRPTSMRSVRLVVACESWERLTLVRSRLSPQGAPLVTTRALPYRLDVTREVVVQA